jgi:hypothetical protein
MWNQMNSPRLGDSTGRSRTDFVEDSVEEVGRADSVEEVGVRDCGGFRRPLSRNPLLSIRVARGRKS